MEISGQIVLSSTRIRLSSRELSKLSKERRTKKSQSNCMIRTEGWKFHRIQTEDFVILTNWTVEIVSTSASHDEPVLMRAAEATSKGKTILAELTQQSAHHLSRDQQQESQRLTEAENGN